MSGSAEMITNEVRRLVLTCRHLQAELEQSIPKKAHQEIVARMQETIDNQGAEMNRMESDLEKAVAISSELSNIQSLISTQTQEISSQNKSIQDVSGKIAEGTVPRQIYEQSLAATRSLEESARRAFEQKAAELKNLEARNHELLEKISGMVPRSEYLAVQAALAESIPRIKYEEELTKLHDQTVAKDQYLKAEARISELESILDVSVPKSEFMDLMREVSTLTNGPLAAPEPTAEAEKPAEAPQILTN